MAEQHRVAVVGAGLMGAAIAQLLASAGNSVAVVDPNPDALARLDDEFARISRLMGDDGQAELRVSKHGDLQDAVSEVDFVIEAATERRDLKLQIFEQLGRFTAPDAVLATNSSSIPVGILAEVAAHPERVVAAHFFNPPYAVRLVEVVQAELSEPAAVARTIRLLSDAGMHPVHVKRDIPGIIGNRLQHALKREAIALVAAGVCDAETIDTVVKLGFGARMAVLGPLEQSDLVGLDLTLAIHETLMPDLDTTAEPNRLLVDKVARGETGMKAGRGFREWTPEAAQQVRDRLNSYLAAAAREGARNG